MKLKLLAACAAALLLTACGDMSDAEKTTLNAGDAIKVGEFKGQPIFYQRVRDPEDGGSEYIYIIPGAATSYEQSCGKSCVETITTVPAPALTPREQALARLSPEDKAALGL